MFLDFMSFVAYGISTAAATTLQRRVIGLSGNQRQSYSNSYSHLSLGFYFNIFFY